MEWASQHWEISEVALFRADAFHGSFLHGDGWQAHTSFRSQGQAPVDPKSTKARAS